MALFGVEFGAQAGEGSGGFGSFVRGAGDAFAASFVVVEAGWVLLIGGVRFGDLGEGGVPFSMLFGPSFDVFVLRLGSILALPMECWK